MVDEATMTKTPSVDVSGKLATPEFHRMKKKVAGEVLQEAP